MNSQYEAVIDDWEYIQKLFDYTLETKPELVLETGTFAGRAAVCILTAMRLNHKGRLITMDNGMWTISFNGSVPDGSTKLALERFEKMKFSNVEFLNCNCLNPPESVTKQKYDFIFLDTVHCYDHVHRELGIYSKLTDNIFIHDVESSSDAGSSKAVLEFLDKNTEWRLNKLGTKFGLWLISKIPFTQSKTLVVTTAKDSQLLRTFLPSLEGKGEYNGDILVIDYDLSQHALDVLSKKPNVRVIKSKPVYECLASDRHRAFWEALKYMYQWYETILIIDGNDIEFCKPIQPLFDLATEKVCYVTENRVNGTWVKYTGPPDVGVVWDEIKNKLIINAGVYVGPSKLIFTIQEHIAKNLEYNSNFGADQLLLNAMIYYYGIPSKEIDKIWNYDARPIGAVDPRSLMEVAIIHRI